MTNRKTYLALALCLISGFIGSDLLAYNTGDYRTKWGGAWETPDLWQVYNGNAWVNANAVPSPNLNTDIYIQDNISCNTHLVLSARMIISNQLYLRNGLLINPGAEMELGVLRLSANSKVTNNGSILATSRNSSITLEGGAIMENNSSLISSSNRFAFNALANSILIMGENGEISGDGNFSTGYGTQLEIAHPLGLDGALALNGNEAFSQNYFTFNGHENQITGESMPDTALGLVFDNPATVTLSQSIEVVNEILLTSGTTLDTGLNTIGSDYYGSGIFNMEEGSSLYTANPQGISSTGNTGAIQVGERIYHSSANYGFNGDEAQQVGIFITVPAVDPEGRVVVNSIIVDNPAGVEFNGSLVIQEVIVVNSGTATGNLEIDGEDSWVDGINSSFYYHSFEPNGVHISNYRPQTDTNNNQPDNVHRRWNITGNFTGIKRITFYWDAEDDADIDWTDSVPVVKKGGELISSNEYDLVSEPRWITVQISDLNSRASFTIVKGDDDTLPVELSAYNVILEAGNVVRVDWISQTETNLIGYRILRSNTDKLDKAEAISKVIAAVNSSQPTYYSFQDKELSISGTYYYWLESLDLDGSSMFFGPLKIAVQLSDLGSAPQIPKRNGISKLYPNPFNAQVSIAYELAAKSPLQITIYNQRGQLVRELYSGTKDAGRYSLYWDGLDRYGQECPSGTYIMKLQHQTGSSVAKALLLK